MARFTSLTLLAALVAALALASAALADDTDLFLKGNLPPNVLVILDTSQSMSWYDKDGNTLGDEFTGFAGKPASRIAGAKKVLSDTIIAFSGEINFGLASFNQGDAATNVVVWPTNTGGFWSYYYSEDWSGVPFSNWVWATLGNRYYLRPDYFNLCVVQAGVCGPADPNDAAGYDPATLRPNSDSFTITWRFQPSLNPNPQKVFWPGQAYIPPKTHDEDKCKYQQQRSDDNQASWYFWGRVWYDVPAGCPNPGPLPGETQVPR